MTQELPRTSAVCLDPSDIRLSDRPWLGTLIVVLVYLLAFTTKVMARWGLTGSELTDPSRLILQIVWAGILSIAALGATVFIDRLPLSSIGIRRLSLSNTLLGVLFFIIGNAVQHLLWPVVVRSGLTFIQIRVWDAPPLLEWTSIFAATIAEELVFRGYLIERIRAISGRTGIAVVFSCLAFAIWHLPLWGAADTIIAGSWGIILSILYIWRRNLPTCMLVHFLIDALGSADIRFAGPVRWGAYVGFGIYVRFFAR